MRTYVCTCCMLKRAFGTRARASRMGAHIFLAKEAWSGVLVTSEGPDENVGGESPAATEEEQEPSVGLAQAGAPTTLTGKMTYCIDKAIADLILAGKRV